MRLPASLFLPVTLLPEPKPMLQAAHGLQPGSIALIGTPNCESRTGEFVIVGTTPYTAEGVSTKLKRGELASVLTFAFMGPGSGTPSKVSHVVAATRHDETILALAAKIDKAAKDRSDRFGVYDSTALSMEKVADRVRSVIGLYSITPGEGYVGKIVFVEKTQDYAQNGEYVIVAQSPFMLHGVSTKGNYASRCVEPLLLTRIDKAVPYTVVGCREDDSVIRDLIVRLGKFVERRNDAKKEWVGSVFDEAEATHKLLQRFLAEKETSQFNKMSRLVGEGIVSQEALLKATFDTPKLPAWRAEFETDASVKVSISFDPNCPSSCSTAEKARNAIRDNLRAHLTSEVHHTPFIGTIR